MNTISSLIQDLQNLGVDPHGTLLFHSSMKRIGETEGGADAVLDALCRYMKDGLLVLPTHTWAQMSPTYTVFDVANEPSCVGLLTNLFRNRPGVVRSFHPTHSVAAFGADALSFTAGEEATRTPCPRFGCWGKLYDRHATILFAGCTLKNNTFLHGVEEWCDTPNRLALCAQKFTVIAPDGRRLSVPQYRHHTETPGLDVSDHYDRMERIFRDNNAVRSGTFGMANCLVADAVRMADLTAPLLLRNPQLFDTGEML